MLFKQLGGILLFCPLFFYSKKPTICEGTKLVFVVSDECGYCLDIVPYSLKLYEEYKIEVEFLSFYENDSTELLWQLRGFGIKNSLDIPWKKIYNADSLIKKLPIDEGKPKTLIYKNGNLQHIISGYSKDREHQIDSTLSSVLR